ncbi:MAG: hypothetical protein ACE5LS_01000 [Thermoplasmata archaeon]
MGRLLPLGPHALRRAAHWDGVFPLVRTGEELYGSPTPRDVREISAFVNRHRRTQAPFEVAVGGATLREDAQADADWVAAFAEAGATWWLEGPVGGEDRDYLRDLIPEGPPGS